MTIFDHINSITYSKIEWDSLSSDDKKSWETYMINRFISQKVEYIELVNFIQKYSFLEPKYIYNIYKGLLPKQREYFKYIKATSKKVQTNEDIKALARYWMCSCSEAVEYMDILPKKTIKEILNQIK